MGDHSIVVLGGIEAELSRTVDETGPAAGIREPSIGISRLM